jgi:WD40 repeat protein
MKINMVSSRGISKNYWILNLVTNLISLDDSSLASGSDDLTIRICDTVSRQCIKILNHNGWLHNINYSTLFIKIN